MPAVLATLDLALTEGVCGLIVLAILCIALALPEAPRPRCSSDRDESAP